MRAYLLGLLAEEGVERVELRLLSDDRFFEEMEAVEAELLDEYARGELTPEERAQAERQFLRAPGRRRRLAFAEALYEEAAAPAAAEGGTPPPDSGSSPQSTPRETTAAPLPFRPRRFHSATLLKLAAAIVVAAGLGLTLWRLGGGRSEVSRAMVALNAAHRDARLVEPRISGLDYAPTRELRGAARPPTDYASRNLAERLLLEAAAGGRDAEAHHALGRLYLSEGKLDEAQDQFEKAREAGAGGARLESDLGALMLERGKAERAADAGRAAAAFGRSLEHFERALKDEPALPEALFNRALVFEHLRLPRQARDAWRAYLAQDAASPWADEARRRLAALGDEGAGGAGPAELYESFARAYREGDAEAAWGAVRRGRSRAGHVVVERLLDEWHEHAAAGREAEAAERLRMLAHVGELEEARAGDRHASEVAAFYARSGAAARPALATARRLKSQGMELYDRAELEPAIARFEEAAGLFAAAGDAGEALLAESWAGFGELRIPLVAESRRRFERLAAEFEARGYRSLLAQALHAQGDARTSTDDFSGALDFAARALPVAEQVQDDVTRLRCLQLLVSMHLMFGNHVESLRYASDALAAAPALPFNPKVDWNFYHQGALGFHGLGLPAAAFAYEAEALRLAEVARWPIIISLSHARLGDLYGARGDYEAARRHSLRAVEAARAIEDERSRLSYLSHATLQLGHLHRRVGDPAAALACYDEALLMFERLELFIYLYETHKGRFLALAAAGDHDAAESALAETLRLFEIYRGKILEEHHRNAFFDVGQDTYDLATDFAFAKGGSPERAFGYAETSRARSLLSHLHAPARVSEAAGGPELTGAPDAQPLALAEIQSALPARARLLQYAVLGDKLITWVVTREGVRSRAQSVTADELGRKVGAYLRQLAGREDGRAEETARELYDLLISPVEEWLEEGGEVCVVPDKALARLPFGALVSPRSGRFLIESYTLVTAPSASVFVACTRAAGARAGHRGGMLSVGNPAFSRQRFPDLPDLPAAGREAEQVARLYGGAALLGAAAREERVRPAMAGAEVIHFASHFVADERSPLLSRLLLADAGPQSPPTREADGLLQAFEVYGMRLPRTRLVVLSACQTGVEQALGGEGAIGMARSFLSAGVPLVVASLWPVESGATAELMIRFHNYRGRGGLTTAEALRRAQQDMIRDPDATRSRPHAWASFVAYGGHEQL